MLQRTQAPRRAWPGAGGIGRGGPGGSRARGPALALFTVGRSYGVTLSAEAPVYLTEKQRRVVSLRDGHGLTTAEIARKLGMKKQNVETCYNRAKVKILEAGPPPTQDLQEASVAALAAIRGKVDDKVLSQQAEEVGWMAIWRLLNDPQVWNRASARDLAAISALMIDKRQLLRGEPTQVIKIQDIRKLDEMAKVLHDEMERRGMLVDVTPEKGDGGNDDGRDASGD